MAYTNSATKTESFTRIFGIKNQFKIAFKRLMNYSDKQCKKYLDAIDNHAINDITFWTYTYNEQGEREKWCQLTIYVDWDAHQHFILKGEEQITLHKLWNGTTPEIDVAIEMIEEAILKFDLTPTFSVGFIEDINKSDYDHYMSHLGLVRGTEVKWKGGMKTVYKKSPKELSEITAEVAVSEKIYDCL